MARIVSNLPAPLMPCFFYPLDFYHPTRLFPFLRVVFLMRGIVMQALNHPQVYFPATPLQTRLVMSDFQEEGIRFWELKFTFPGAEIACIFIGDEDIFVERFTTRKLSLIVHDSFF
ncbi:MAG: hypothetical protein HYZ47_03850 [Simkania negevensis]|nr:hypothetical protein [Simkania negevensis]